MLPEQNENTPIQHQHQDAAQNRVVFTDVLRRDGGLTRLIELRRPEKRNCLSLKMLDALLFALSTSGKADCIVLTGDRPSFCAGIDLKEIGGPDGVTEASVLNHLIRLVDIYRCLLTAETRTIVLAHGYAAGGGTGLLASAKNVIVSNDFQLKLPGDKLARFAAVALPVLKLRATIKPAQAEDWLGQVCDAATAKDLGLVDQIVSPERLDEIVGSVRRGSTAPEFRRFSLPTASALKEALVDLEQFLNSLQRPSTSSNGSQSGT